MSNAIASGKKRVVVITGAFGALGSAVARCAAAAGDTVARIDFAATPPDADTLALGGVDLADPAAAEAAFRILHERAGQLNALINVAGGFRWQTVEEGDPAVWDKLYAINVRTALNATRAALPHLRKATEPRIVNVGAQGALRAAAGMGAYAAAKSGIHRLTESLAEELKGVVTVNAVLPSIIDTPANRADMPSADFSAWVRPDDLAAVILFLASEAARAVTGALIPVTGKV